jgi:hypothetical protein
MGMGLLLAASVYAGETATKSTAKPTDKAAEMQAMKAEMMKCSVCKPMASKMEMLGPAMSTEVVKLNNGMAIVHEISDPKMLPTFRTACAEMHKAGEASKTFTPEQTKTQLCTVCQEMHTLMAQGATMSLGDTKNGSIFALTSADPAVQTKIASFQMKCAEMGM